MFMHVVQSVTCKGEWQFQAFQAISQNNKTDADINGNITTDADINGNIT